MQYTTAKHGVMGLFKSTYADAQSDGISYVALLSPAGILKTYRRQYKYHPTVVLRDWNHRPAHSSRYLRAASLQDPRCYSFRHQISFRFDLFWEFSLH